MAMEDTDMDRHLPPGWREAFSRSQNRSYFHHSQTNTSLWTMEEVNDWEKRENKGAAADAPNSSTGDVSHTSQAFSSLTTQPTCAAGFSNHTKKQRTMETRLAIIVPFRDLDPKQMRQQHLEKFAPYMSDYLAKLDLAAFKIFVIEQSDDQRKFNRGKLLNLGFMIARGEGFNTFVFHDVDLLPQEVIGKWYEQHPTPGQPVHIARCWSRYNQSKTYLGGIVSFCLEDFEKIDGFPNLYWGWGGEDDELSKRVTASGLRVVGPERDVPNAVVDMEEMNLDQKLQWLRENRAIKCEIKWEVNDEHEKFRRKDSKPLWWGVKGLEGYINVIGRDDSRFVNCSIVKVDVGLNYDENGEGHWTNTGKVPTSTQQPQGRYNEGARNKRY